MTKKSVQNAVLAAQEFINRAEELLRLSENSPHGETWPKESGSVRRQSMELSRCLSTMRQSGRSKK
jgi:hypothetical protein